MEYNCTNTVHTTEFFSMPLCAWYLHSTQEILLHQYPAITENHMLVNHLPDIILLEPKSRFSD